MINTPIKIENFKNKKIIDSNISNLNILFSDYKENKRAFLKKSIIYNLLFFTITLFVFYFTSFYEIYLVFIVIFIIFSFYLFKTFKKNELFYEKILNEYNYELKNNSDEFTNYLIIPFRKDIKIDYINNYNVFFSNILRDPDYKEKYLNLNFIPFKLDDYKNELIINIEKEQPELYNSYKNSKNFIDLLSVNFFIQASTRFNLGDNVLFFIDIFNKELILYLVIDTDPIYKLSDEFFEKNKDFYSSYLIKYYLTRLNFLRDRNFQKLKNEQNILAKELIFSLREQYITSTSLKKNNIYIKRKI